VGDRLREPIALLFSGADFRASTKHIFETFDRAGRRHDGSAVVFDDSYGRSHRGQDGDFATRNAFALSRRRHRFVGFGMSPAGRVALRLGAP
jgi:hypothetical protein